MGVVDDRLLRRWKAMRAERLLERAADAELEPVAVITDFLSEVARLQRQRERERSNVVALAHDDR